MCLFFMHRNVIESEDKHCGTVLEGGLVGWAASMQPRSRSNRSLDLGGLHRTARCEHGRTVGASEDTVPVFYQHSHRYCDPH